MVVGHALVAAILRVVGDERTIGSVAVPVHRHTYSPLRARYNTRVPWDAVNLVFLDVTMSVHTVRSSYRSCEIFLRPTVNTEVLTSNCPCCVLFSRARRLLAYPSTMPAPHDFLSSDTLAPVL